MTDTPNPAVIATVLAAHVRAHHYGMTPIEVAQRLSPEPEHA